MTTTRKRATRKTTRKKADPRTTVKLSVNDRLVLQGVIRERTRGNLALLRISEEMMKRIGIDSTEARRINLRQKGKNLLWDLTTATDKALRFDPFELGLITKSLLAMHKEDVLTLEHLGVCRKFIPDELKTAEVKPNGDAP